MTIDESHVHSVDDLAKLRDWKGQGQVVTVESAANGVVAGDSAEIPTADPVAAALARREAQRRKGQERKAQPANRRPVQH